MDIGRGIMILGAIPPPLEMVFLTSNANKRYALYFLLENNNCRIYSSYMIETSFYIMYGYEPSCDFLCIIVVFVISSLIMDYVLG